MITKQVVEELERSKWAIVDSWVHGAEVKAIFASYGIEPLQFQRDFGLPIVVHFLRVLRGVEQVGQCPYMIEFVLFLRDRHARVSDIVSLCLNLRSEVESLAAPVLLAENQATLATGLREITHLFDVNLTSVLRFFDATMSDKEVELQEYLRLIDQHVLISKTDRAGVVTFVSDAFCRLCGYTRDELMGRPHSLLRHPDMPASLYTDLWGAISAGRLWKGEIKNRAKDGHSYWIAATISPLCDRQGNITGYMSVRHDISDRVLAFTDPLTQISNRLKFDDALAFELERARRYGNTFSLVLFDIDNFKEVNDTFGHERGDRILRELVEVVRPAVRETDLFARWGGEEFVVLLIETKVDGAARFANKLRGTIAGHSFDGISRLTCSLGVAEYRSGDTPATLFARADEGLYNAKRAGRDRVAMCTENAAPSTAQ
jgi:diguanylate cyclase (GGDEF)-like protein/PAS domain S-box-containing protein